MYFADIRNPVRFEINASWIRHMLEEIAPGRDVTEYQIRELCLRIEDEVSRNLGMGHDFNLLSLISEHLMELDCSAA